MGSRPELKVEDEVGFIKFFRNLPVKGDATIRIFDRGDWYTAHGEDANFIARTVYKTTSVLRQLGREPGLPSVTMTITVFRNFLREALFRLGKRVEIWETTGRMNWKIGKQASPGNLQDVEDDLGGYIDAAPIILAVKVSTKASEARNVGISFADASVRELGVSEFLDNDLYSNFESILIQLGVKECLVQADGQQKDVELQKLKTIADNCGCAIAERSAGDFLTKDVEHDLTRLLRDETAVGMLPQTDLKLAMGSAAALIKYLGVMSDPVNYGQFQLYQHDLSQYMKLDASALKALNLMPGPRDGSKNMSLYGLLNHCKTPIGSRLLAQWLKQPLMNLQEIEKRQHLVEVFVMDTELRQTMQETHLRSIPDLYRLAKKFQRKAANLEDVVRAYQVAIRLPGFVGTFEGVMDDTYKDALEEAYTSKLREYSDGFSRLQEMVETTIDLDALENHEFLIKPEFDEGLRIVRKKLDKLRSDMDIELRRVSKDLGQEIEKKLFLENHRVHGWCMRLTRTEAGCIRNKKGYQECSTQKNGVYFTTTNLQSLRREHDQLSENYNRTQNGLVAEVVGVAASYVPVLERLASTISHLDVIIAFAHASIYAPTPYTRPKLFPRSSECATQNISGETLLCEARHPCLEQQDDVSFITNDVHLRPSSDGPSFLIITGPNMGGKSTYIRMIASIALLAQIGCFVPCAEGATLTIYDSILARVGASDSQLKGVSTFMAEMLETANILKSATRDSLIVIDELGRGTSTYDGFGLAWAIAEYIVGRIGACAAFATHFHELTRLGDTWPQVRNLHVVAHVSGEDGASVAAAAANGNASEGKRREVTLLYRVEPGISDQSFGIHVAELVRFPQKVINMAKRKAEELEDFEGERKRKQKLLQGVTDGGADSDTDAMAVDVDSKGNGPTAATATAEDKPTAEEVARGSALLKDVLREWKKDVESKGLSRAEQVGRMKELVNGNAELLGNRFFKSIRTL